MTIYTFFQYPDTTNRQRKKTNITNERRIYSDILAETIKVFKRLALQSTINDSAYYNLDEDDAESDPKSDQLLATHTSDGKKIKFTDTGTTNRNLSTQNIYQLVHPKVHPSHHPDDLTPDCGWDCVK